MKNEKLNQIKSEYDSVNVPEELKQKIEEVIEMAKQENRKNLVKEFFERAAITAAAAVAALMILTNTSEVAAKALEKIPVIGAFTKVITFRTYEDKKGNYEAKVETPQIQETTKNEQIVNKSVQEYTDQIIARYKQDQKEYGEKGREAVETSYKVITDTKDFFTLRIDTLVQAGSSDSFSVFYHIDKKLDKIVTLKDLFKDDSDYVTVISEEIKKQMQEQNKNADLDAGDAVYFIDDKEIPEEEQFKAIKPEQNFYIDGTGNLTIVFDKYEVAPGYVGQPEFKIPGDVLESIVNTESILAKK